MGRIKGAAFGVTAGQIEAALQLQEAMSFWYVTNRLFADVKRSFPSNTDIAAVLLKVTVIDRLYATNVFAIYKAAQHIVSVLSAPAGVPQGRELVAALARLEVAGKKRKAMSFASKYAHFFLEDSLPIMDSYAALVLCLHLGEPKSMVEIWRSDYGKYSDAIDQLRGLNGLTASVDHLDTNLWLGGLSVEWLKKHEQAEINSEAKQTFKVAGESQLQITFGPLWARVCGGRSNEFCGEITHAVSCSNMNTNSEISA